MKARESNNSELGKDLQGHNFSWVSKSRSAELCHNTDLFKGPNILANDWLKKAPSVTSGFFETFFTFIESHPGSEEPRVETS